MNIFKSSNPILIIFFFIITIPYLILLITGFQHYPGNKFFYLLLAFLIIFYLFFSFFKSNYFFDFILSIFIFLGFGLKLTASLTFINNYMQYNFLSFFNSKSGLLMDVSIKLLDQNNCKISDFTSLEKCKDYTDIINDSFLYDNSLLISCIGITAVIFSSHIINYIDNKYNFSSTKKNVSTNHFYEKIRTYIFILFPLSILIICIINFNLSIYQKGVVSDSIIPLIRPVFTWLLLFGFTAFSSLLIFLEMKRKKSNLKTIILLSIIEPIISSISILSRGAIFNIFALIIPVITKKKLNNLRILFIIFFATFMFFISLVSIHFIRTYTFQEVKISTSEKINNSYNGILNFKENPDAKVSNRFLVLLTERWVGITEVVLISNSNKISIDFFKKSFLEKQADNKQSFFDKEIYNQYTTMNFQRHNFTSVPGLIGFLYFSKNEFIVFFGCFLFSFVSIILELISLKLSKHNYFFSSLIGNVLAFRLIHFGIYPIESYKLFSAIIFTIFLIYISSLFCLTERTSQNN